MLLKDRVNLARKLRDRRFSVAERFALRFPHQAKIESDNIALHLAFLAGAIETGKPSVFEDYVQWVARTMVPRGVAPDVIDELLERIPLVLDVEFVDPERQILSEFIEAGRHAFLDPAFGLPREQHDEVEKNGIVARFTDAILSGERKVIIEPALKRVGELWEANRISVAEEHMATAVVQTILPEFFRLIPNAEIERGHIIITGVHGELHAIGAHMVADMLQADGWTVRLLGTNTPPAGVLRLIERQQASVLGMSAATLLSVPSVTEVIEDVHREFGRAVPDLWREIGADGFAPDLISAVQTMREPRWMRRSHA